ncbi:3908_t:CDS:2 [Funneliformis geosporum]|uniref:3908_t:CDS:1 n=1 Tax=Funneliformis geosporum TaxID=1117311 RepID=A0A9W4SFI9_9GLOM|nr:3908_t:CDS:2 [Funneliformis geosporum]
MKSDDEIIWGDDDLDRNQEDLIQNLITQMQNYVPPAHKSTYTGNSARTKRRHHAQVKRDAEKNESKDDYDLIYNSQQTINSLKAQLKEKNLNEGYELRLTAILQYMRLLEFQNSN